MFPWARHAPGLLVPWARRLVVPWACPLVVPWALGFSHGHAVVFQFPDNEELLMTMEKSDTVMLTFAIHVACILLVLLYYRGPVWTSRRGVCGCSNCGGIGEAKGRGGARKGIIR